MSPSEITQADTLLLKFCQDIERVYDKTEIAPNMHMHAHLCECITVHYMDSGYFHSNATTVFLEDLPLIIALSNTNLCKGFLEDNDFLSVPNLVKFNEEFSTLFSPHPSTGSAVLTLHL